MVDVRIEADALLLYFADKADSSFGTDTPFSSPKRPEQKRRRRARHRRNRMKTRGWDIVGRMVNRRGQACTVYKPFVDALNHSLSTEEQKATVARILRSNGNRPSHASVNYFLENTLEYLKGRKDNANMG